MIIKLNVELKDVMVLTAFLGAYLDQNVDDNLEMVQRVITTSINEQVQSLEQIHEANELIKKMRDEQV